MELPTDVEVSTHPHGTAAIAPAVVVEVDRVEEVKAVLQEERDALRGIFCGQDGRT